MKKVRNAREEKIESVKRRLLLDSFPRLEISIILFFTALAGFLTSFLLLHLGIYSMAVRYPLIISFAYCFFLVLLRTWLWLRSSDLHSVSDLSNLDFVDSPEIGTEAAFGSAESGSMMDALSFDLEEIGLVILAAAAIIGGLLAFFYVIYIAPILLAEIFVDGILITGLYNRVKKIEQRFWLETAVRKTLLPAVLAALFFGITGFALQKIVPEANSIGELWHQLT